VSVFNRNTRRVLSYDVLRQQKTGVMTRVRVSGRTARVGADVKISFEPLTENSKSLS